MVHFACSKKQECVFQKLWQLHPMILIFQDKLCQSARPGIIKVREVFLPTKNKSSVRKIQIDWQIVVKFSELIKSLPKDKPIFVREEKI